MFGLQISLLVLTAHISYSFALLNGLSSHGRARTIANNVGGSKVRTSMEIQDRKRNNAVWENNRDRCRRVCAEPQIDPVQDRREALFASIGAVWAVTTTAVQPAVAAYGADAKIELPNPYQQMSDRATRQCLVESLGNRECLVYADQADKFVYKGVDSQALVSRIEKATTALASIPDYAEMKQWTKITGVLTGPMGELIRTMNQVADISEGNSGKAKEKVKLVKTDLYAMNDGVSRKDQKMVLKYHEAATNDLVAFLKLL